MTKEITQEKIKQDASEQETIIARISFEHHNPRDTLGIGESRPRLSWLIETPVENWQQTGYEIEAYKPDGQLYQRTDQVKSDQPILVDWPFTPLASGPSVGVTPAGNRLAAALRYSRTRERAQ